jgi:hypothetical protein
VNCRPGSFGACTIPRWHRSLIYAAALPLSAPSTCIISHLHRGIPDRGYIQSRRQPILRRLSLPYYRNTASPARSCYRLYVNRDHLSRHRSHSRAQGQCSSERAHRLRRAQQHTKLLSFEHQGWCSRTWPTPRQRRRRSPSRRSRRFSGGRPAARCGAHGDVYQCRATCAAASAPPPTHMHMHTR